MELITKPDFAEARERWRAFWNHEIIKRPIVCITAPREGAPSPPGGGFLDTGISEAGLVEDAERARQRVEATFWGGDAIPSYGPGFGPDQFAAFLGAQLVSHPTSWDTTWAMPAIKSWADAPPLRFDPENTVWKKLLTAISTCARLGEGRFLVGLPDIHSNLDALSALRGPQQLMFDLVDVPEVIDRAMGEARAVFQPVYEGVCRAGNMRAWGTTGWLDMYCEGRFATVQSDVIYMLSPQHFRRFVLPALEEETSFLDHSAYHYDGPNALVHLNDILAIETLDCIQWTPGTGNPTLSGWIDLLKTMQAAGKSVYLGGEMDELKLLHRELRPELCVYSTAAPTEQEARQFLKWMEDNT